MFLLFNMFGILGESIQKVLQMLINTVRTQAETLHQLIQQLITTSCRTHEFDGQQQKFVSFWEDFCLRK